MATFNVFVEGAIDDGPMALAELAEAMGERYGLAPRELVARLQRGRFRVKSNVDAATAERYKHDLEAIGARVLIEDAALSPRPTPVAGMAAVRPSSPSLPPATQPRASTPPPIRPSAPPSGLSAAGAAYQRPSTPIPTDMASGLAAAFSDAPAQTDLGALGEGSLSLASLDGEEAPAASGAFDLAPAPPPPPPAARKPEPKPKPAPSQPLDMFAPPDAGDQAFVVDIADEEVADRARKQSTSPPESTTTTPVSPVPSQPLRRTPVGMDAVAPPVVARPQFSRGRFVGIVGLALVIGFIPAHFVAQLREKSAFAAIDKQVAEVHAAADSDETWLALDSARDKLREEKESKRTNIALTSMLLWAVVAAGAGIALSRVPLERKKPA